ncbi:hypothetical protein [Streptomyces megasporus]|uniref:hypothetical protein n=1 Tax=Streptomyces megasporus TaxID=44060 RepID=UPI00068F69D3
MEQSCPGGRIVAPWGTHYGNGDAVVRLTVSRDGKSASGAFTGPVEFTKLRAQRLPPVAHSAYVTGSVADADESSTTPAEEEFAGERFGVRRGQAGTRAVRTHRHAGGAAAWPDNPADSWPV